MRTTISPLVSISLSALTFHVDLPFLANKRYHRIWTLVGSSLLLYCMPPHSVLAWWKLTTILLNQWPFLLKSPPSFAHGGPLGIGCYKVCEVIAAFLLWHCPNPWSNESDQPFPIIMISDTTSTSALWMGMGVVLVLSIASSLVLHVWSKHQTHTHEGVRSWVNSSVGRSLSSKEHLHLFVLAAINAACEEVSSRGVWKHEFAKYTSLRNANLLQAIAFGLWHYHGIPSGWTGVGLTFVYGMVMGLLQDYFGGLLMPILAHTLADYYIFSVLARQEQQQVKQE